MSKLINRDEVLWFEKPTLHYSKRYFPLKDEREDFFIKSCNPFSKNYFSIYNPLFLYSVDKKKSLDNIRIHLRDGIVPVLHAKKEGILDSFKDDIIQMHHLFYDFIDDNQKRFAYYDITNIDPVVPKNRKKIIITGLFSNNYIGKLDVDLFFKKIKRFELLKDLDVFLFVPLKEWDVSCHEVFSYFLNNVNKSFGEKVNFIKWDDIKRINCFKDFYYVNLNSYLLYVDSYLDHFLMAQNAYMLNLLPIDMNNFSIREERELSLNHKISIVSSICSPEFVINKDIEEVKKVVYNPTSEIGNNYPWDYSLINLGKKIKNRILEIF